MISMFVVRVRRSYSVEGRQYYYVTQRQTVVVKFFACAWNLMTVKPTNRECDAQPSNSRPQFSNWFCFRWSAPLSTFKKWPTSRRLCVRTTNRQRRITRESARELCRGKSEIRVDLQPLFAIHSRRQTRFLNKILSH